METTELRLSDKQEQSIAHSTAWLLRASFRYAYRQDWDTIAKALKPVYTAPTEDAATSRFLEFCEEWGHKYPAIVRLWENAWAPRTRSSP